MPKNEGGLDRVLRVIAGLAVLSLAFVGPKTPWAYLGLVPLLTGALGYLLNLGFLLVEKKLIHWSGKA